jgi:hypothetical protein
MSSQRDELYEDLQEWRRDATVMESDAMIMLPTVSVMRILGAVQDQVQAMLINPLSKVAEIRDLHEVQLALEEQLAAQ